MAETEAFVSARAMAESAQIAAELDRIDVHYQEFDVIYDAFSCGEISRAMYESRLQQLTIPEQI